MFLYWEIFGQTKWLPVFGAISDCVYEARADNLATHARAGGVCAVAYSNFIKLIEENTGKPIANFRFLMKKSVVCCSYFDYTPKSICKISLMVKYATAFIS